MHGKLWRWMTILVAAAAMAGFSQAPPKPSETQPQSTTSLWDAIRRNERRLDNLEGDLRALKTDTLSGASQSDLRSRISALESQVQMLRSAPPR